MGSREWLQKYRGNDEIVELIRDRIEKRAIAKFSQDQQCRLDPARWENAEVSQKSRYTIEAAGSSIFRDELRRNGSHLSG